MAERAPDGPTRDFTVAVFVVHAGRVLLHRHRRLDRWLPPGGHVESNELPDEAAVREVREETGVAATLIGPSPITVGDPDQPRQLCRPAGVQLARIARGHEHIDLIYLAAGEPAVSLPDVGWFGPDEWPALGLTDEVEAWCRYAIAELSGRAGRLGS